MSRQNSKLCVKMSDEKQYKMQLISMLFIKYNFISTLDLFGKIKPFIYNLFCKK